MGIELWIRDDDRSHLEEIFELELSKHSDAILTGQLENEGVLAKIGKNFVLGKERIWILHGTQQKYRFVRIDNSSAYRNGLILTPYSAIDVDYHLKSNRIDRRTLFERVELEGNSDEDFVIRVFRTYYSGPLVRKFNERDQHLVLYRANGRRH